MFEDWLETTRELQIKSFGTDPATLEGADLAEYIRWNCLAAIDELMEMLHEVDWKPWTVTNDGFRNRDAFKGEGVDVLHFVANLLVAARTSDEELSTLYRAKQQKNRDRMASKTYDGIKEKCFYCSRAYDDDAVKCRPGSTDMRTNSGFKMSAYCAYTNLS